MRTRFRRLLAIGAVILALAATAATAQTITGRISGTVVDTSGGVLPGVAVTVLEEARASRRRPHGRARRVHLREPAPRELQGQRRTAGFKPMARTGYVLQADGRLTADFKMEVGQLTETVLVTANSETVNTVSGEVARTVDQSQVQDLALNGRNYLQLTTLIPACRCSTTTRSTS